MSKSKIAYKVLSRITITNELVSYNHSWILDSEYHLVPAHTETSLRYFENELIDAKNLRNKFLFVFDTFENALDLVKNSVGGNETFEIWKVKANSPHFETCNGLRADETEYKGTMFCKSLRLIKKVYG